MGRRLAALAAAAALLLSGCGWMDGSYVSVTPHQVGQSHNTGGSASTVSSYAELRSALIGLIDAGSSKGLFTLSEYPRADAETDMERAVQYAMGVYPIGAYAVEAIDYAFGTGPGAGAISVDISYRHTLAQIEQIRTVRWISGAEEEVEDAVDECADSLVLQISGYQDVDFGEIVREYARMYPERVMEVPEVEVRTYPNRGDTRVVELRFSYRTSREQLRSMREQVQPVFSSAALYVSGQAEDRSKFSQLHAFLTERYDDYRLEPSVTPAYSLLCQGMGDSSAFAQVYTAMCSRIGLEARSVCGTRNGEARWWNLIRIDGMWYHLDLLGDRQFRPMTDAEMTGYEWDRTQYPAAEGTGA